jgi:hypothetical protein
MAISGIAKLGFIVAGTAIAWAVLSEVGKFPLPSQPVVADKDDRKDKQPVLRIFLREQLNRSLLRGGIHAEVMPIDPDKFIICGQGINKAVAADLMSSKDLRKSFQQAGIADVDFHTSCDINSGVFFDPDHWIAEYMIPPSSPAKVDRPTARSEKFQPK